MQSIQFPNLGYVQHTVKDEQINLLNKWVEHIDNNTALINHSHVGTITNEYEIADVNVKQELSMILAPMCEQYGRDMHFPIKDKAIGLKTAWCNVQQSGEYFSAHTHNGLFSFALWLKVPFTQQDEQAWREARGKSGRETAAFYFHYTDALGKITPHCLEVDSTWENVIVLFPGEMMHSVTPYYSTVDNRIVVSGNIDYLD